MVELISPIIILGVVLASIIIFREKINKADISLKIGIFSIIVAILGNIFGKFEPIGFLVQRIAIVFIIMSIIIMAYVLIFKSIQGVTVKLILFSLFLFLIFSTLLNSYDILKLDNEFFVYMNTGKTISIVVILMCVLIKSFQLIFGKSSGKNKEDIEELYQSKELQEQ